MEHFWIVLSDDVIGIGLYFLCWIINIMLHWQVKSCSNGYRTQITCNALEVHATRPLQISTLTSDVFLWDKVNSSAFGFIFLFYFSDFLMLIWLNLQQHGTIHQSKFSQTIINIWGIELRMDSQIIVSIWGTGSPHGRGLGGRRGSTQSLLGLFLPWIQPSTCQTNHWHSKGANTKFSYAQGGRRKYGMDQDMTSMHICKKDGHHLAPSEDNTTWRIRDQ